MGISIHKVFFSILTINECYQQVRHSLPQNFKRCIHFVVDTCESDEFTCSNMECRPESVVCDGNDDCGENGDGKQDCSGMYNNISPITCGALVGFNC